MGDDQEQRSGKQKLGRLMLSVYRWASHRHFRTGFSPSSNRGIIKSSIASSEAGRRRTGKLLHSSTKAFKPGLSFSACNICNYPVDSKPKSQLMHLSKLVYTDWTVGRSSASQSWF